MFYLNSRKYGPKHAFFAQFAIFVQRFPTSFHKFSNETYLLAEISNTASHSNYDELSENFIVENKMQIELDTAVILSIADRY